ncbi:MAG: glycosyltransferase family 9 protein [Candidatus Omnitrophota bacterium]
MAKNILVINPFGIGDVLFSTPLVSALKKLYPDSYIAYICNLKTRDILITNPAINEVFVFERDEYRFLWKTSKIGAAGKFLDFWGMVKKKKFDLVFDLSLGKEYAFLCWLVGIKDRRGFDYKNRGRFLNYRVPFDGFNDKPVAEYYLDLMRLAGPPDRESLNRKMVLVTTSEDKEYVDNFLKNSGIGGKDRLICVAPGGGMSFGSKKMGMRRWPVEKFKELAKDISERGGAKVVLLWGPGEEDLIKEIEGRGAKGVITAPKTTARQAAALMKRCAVVMCNDSGLLHLATSQGVNTVSIFGPTDEKVYGPYPLRAGNVVIKSDAECRPCYRKFKLSDCGTKKCLDGISVEEVFKAVMLS